MRRLAGGGSHHPGGHGGRVIPSVSHRFLLACLLAQPLGAQQHTDSSLGDPPAPLVAPHPAAATARLGAQDAWPQPRPPGTDRRAPWWAPVASALVPGAGQFAMGQQRSVGYVVAEGYLLLQALGSRREGQRQRDAYRALAASVARARFSSAPAVGDWDYYESMEKFLESGVYDRIPGGAVDPELDEATFNGARWLLARQIFWRDPRVPPPVGSPEYQRALAFYEARAVRDPYRWSWRDAQLEQDVYRQTIAEANRSYQRAVTLTGIVWMNHLASLVDAYVSMRIRRFGGAGVAGVTVESLRMRLVPVVPSTGGAPVVTWQVRLARSPLRD